MAGRPPGSVEYRMADFADEICAWLESGRTMSSYCAKEGNPSVVTVHRWMDDETFAKRIAAARDKGHDVIADDCVAITDCEPERGPDGKIDPGYVAWQKNRVWTRTQLLAKWNPKKYGDRVDHKHSGNIGLQINIATDDD